MKLEGPRIPPQALEEIERLIASVKWRDSTTYPARMQHAYILRKDVPEVFGKLAAAIQEYGYEDDFYGQANVYLVIGKYKYWAYDTVLNREDVQLTIDRRSKGGIS